MKKRCRHYKQDTAFTVPEILVTVVVAAALIAMMLAGISKLTDAGRKTHCVSNLRQASMAYLSYVTENGGTMPYWDAWYNRGNATGESGMREYMRVSEINDEARIETIWTCPSAQANPATRVSDAALFRRTYVLNLRATSGHKQYSLGSMYKVQNRPSMIQFFDGMIQTRKENANVYHVCATEKYPERFTAPHGGRLNASFMDGHVESMTVEELLGEEGFKLRWTGNP